MIIYLYIIITFWIIHISSKSNGVKEMAQWVVEVLMRSGPSLNSSALKIMTISSNASFY